MIKTVLFIDDNDHILELYEDLLKEMGYKVLTAFSCKEGLVLHEKYKEKIDLYIIDLVMPDMSGIECLQEIRRSKPDAKVIATTGGRVTLGVLKESGFNSVIYKPWLIRDFTNILEGLLLDENEDN